MCRAESVPSEHPHESPQDAPRTPAPARAKHQAPRGVPAVEAGGAPNYEGAYVTVYREYRMLSELGHVLTEDRRGFSTIVAPSSFNIERPKSPSISSAPVYVLCSAVGEQLLKRCKGTFST